MFGEALRTSKQGYVTAHLDPMQSRNSKQTNKQNCHTTVRIIGYLNEAPYRTVLTSNYLQIREGKKATLCARIE